MLIRIEHICIVMRENPSFAYLISQVYDEKVVIASSENETIYTNNLGEAKRFFYEKMIDMDVNQLEEVYTKITQHFLFNMYIISDDIDVYVTFETMNNRGKPLSNLELLKNRLIYVSTLLNVADADKSRLRRDINECWKKIYHILGKSQSNYLLNDYFVVQKIFDKSLTIEDCFNYIQSLSECIDFWGDIKNPLSSKYDDEIKEYIDKINFFSIRRRFYRSRYMIDFSYLNVFLLACFRACNNNNKTLLNFLKILEKYLFSIEFYDGEAIEELCINLFNFAEAVVKLNKGEWVIQGIIDKLKKLSSVSYLSKNGVTEKLDWKQTMAFTSQVNARDALLLGAGIVPDESLVTSTELNKKQYYITQKWILSYKLATIFLMRI